MIEPSRFSVDPTLDPPPTRSLVRSIIAFSLAVMGMVWVPTTTCADPPQSAPASGASGSAAPTPAQKALEAELQQFAKLPVDKAIHMYSKTLTQMRDAEDEYERRWVEHAHDFNLRREAEFKKRVPRDLAEAFKRMTDRAARHAWVVALSKMADAARDAATAKDADQRERAWELRGKFMDELDHGKIPSLVLTETGKRLIEQSNKVKDLWAKAGKMEASLFPRMSREDILEVRKLPAFDALAEQTKALQLSEEVSAILKKAGEKDEDAWVPPDLQAELASWRDPEGFRSQQFEIEKIKDSKAREAAELKHSEDRSRLEDIRRALLREENNHSFSFTTRADWDAAPAETQHLWHNVKAERYGARLKKLEKALARLDD